MQCGRGPFYPHCNVFSCTRTSSSTSTTVGRISSTTIAVQCAGDPCNPHCNVWVVLVPVLVPLLTTIAVQCAGDPFNPIPARWDVVTVMGEPSIAVTPRSSSSSLYSSTQCTPLQHFASIFPFSLSSLALLLIIVSFNLTDQSRLLTYVMSLPSSIDKTIGLWCWQWELWWK